MFRIYQPFSQTFYVFFGLVNQEFCYFTFFFKIRLIWRKRLENVLKNSWLLVGELLVNDWWMVGEWLVNADPDPHARMLFCDTLLLTNPFPNDKF